MNTMSQFSQDSTPLKNIKQSKASALGEGSTQASTTLIKNRQQSVGESPQKAKPLPFNKKAFTRNPSMTNAANLINDTRKGSKLRVSKFMIKEGQGKSLSKVSVDSNDVDEESDNNSI